MTGRPTLKAVIDGLTAIAEGLDPDKINVRFEDSGYSPDTTGFPILRLERTYDADLKENDHVLIIKPKPKERMR